MQYLDILASIHVERLKRLKALDCPDFDSLDLWTRANKSLKGKDQQPLLSSAYDFAKSINYHHVGLDSQIYFAHPVRVSALATLISRTASAEVGIIGLLHNIFEVTDISVSTLDQHFDPTFGEQILALTVDRSLQWDEEYKKEYYARLNTFYHNACVVKIIDKLDNLFVLGLNPSDSIREMYLHEIETYIYPMVKKFLPDLESYFVCLVEDCHSTGFISQSTYKQQTIS